MKIINSPQAPAAVGPYSHAAVAGNTVYCAGQIPLDPVTMEIKGATIEEQTRQVMENIKVVLAQAGTGLAHVVKTTVFLDSMDDFAGMNQVYEAAFNGHKPARSAVEVGRLPRDAKVEIECIAVIEQEAS